MTDTEKSETFYDATVGNTTVHVKIDSFREKWYVDVRMWEIDNKSVKRRADGTFEAKEKPTQKGVKFTLENYEALKNVFEDVDEQLKKLQHK
jgi:hypothetical protein